jgi:hypothetical protein
MPHRQRDPAAGDGIWTCRKDNIRDLHFDIRQYNCIDWAQPDDLRDRLRSRIVALIGEGPLGASRQVLVAAG